MELILVRHALPHAEQPCLGVRADPSLTAQGRAQADRLVDALAEDDVAAIVSSPAARAQETAAPLAAARALPATVDHSVQEYDATGRGYVPIHVAIAQGLPDAMAIAAGELPAHVAAEAFRTRVVDGLESLVTRHPGRRSVVVVCHGGVVNAYLSHVLGLSAGMVFPLDYVGVTRVVASRDGRRRVRTVNETYHLRDILAPMDVWPLTTDSDPT